MRLRHVSLASCVFIVLGCSSEAPNPYARLEEDIGKKMSEGGFPGLAAALIEHGDVAWTGTFGYADLEAKRPVDEHTPFLVASISKTITTALLVQLVEEGKIALDDPIDPALALSARHPDHLDLPITPRMLATHTSGIVDDWVYLASVTSGRDPSGPLHDFAAGYLVPEHFGHVPGERHDYSNSGFGILGAVVEGAAGEKFYERAKRTIFEPTGMNDSGFMLAEMDLAAVAVPYSGTYKDGFTRGEHQGFEFYPATSLKTSISDLSKWLMTFMRFGDAGNGARVFSEETGRSMREIQDAVVDEDQALTWYREELGGRVWLGHSGSALGASALMFFREDDGVGFIVLTNGDAFIRSRLGFTEGRDALYAVAELIAAEAKP